MRLQQIVQPGGPSAFFKGDVQTSVPLIFGMVEEGLLCNHVDSYARADPAHVQSPDLAWRILNF